jgi:hypothetical protein
MNLSLNHWKDTFLEVLFMLVIGLSVLSTVTNNSETTNYYVHSDYFHGDDWVTLKRGFYMRRMVCAVYRFS